MNICNIAFLILAQGEEGACYVNQKEWSQTPLLPPEVSWEMRVTMLGIEKHTISLQEPLERRPNTVVLLVFT